jgi:micrococcal nuclease
VHPTKPVECFGPEASAHTAQLLPPGTRVRLERDVEARDHYGRLLAYVHRVDDDLFVNRSLVDGGFADVLVIEPNHAYAEELRAGRAEADRAGKGRWSACARDP